MDGHFCKVAQDDDRGNSDLASGGADRFVITADGELEPFREGDWLHTVLAIDLECFGIVGGQVRKGRGWRDD